MTARRIIPFLLSASTGLVPLAADAQEVQREGEAARAGLRADADYTDVYLNDSFEADDAILRARRLADREQWSEAAELLQRTADHAGDKLAKVARGQYVGIREHISDLIASWPAAGISAYRSLFDSAADQLLRQLGDSRSIGELLPLFERFFCTTAGGRLADRIGVLAIESGDFPLARRMYVRTIERHPDRKLHYAKLQAMIRIIAALEEVPPVVDFDETSNETMVRWMGENRRLADVLTEIQGSFSKSSLSLSNADWPIFGGSSERNRKGSCSVDEPGLLWSFDWPGPPRDEIVNAADDEDQPGSSASKDPCVYPVVRGDMVFVQSEGSVFALRLSTGVPAWQYAFRDTRSGSTGRTDVPVPSWQSVATAEGRVFATHPPASLFPAYGGSRVSGEIVALNAITGQLLWRAEPSPSPDRNTELTFDSAPLIAADRVFVMARRRHAFGFEDAYLYGFRVLDGSLEFRTHLGSGPTSQIATGQSTISAPALHGDTIYVGTNLGSIAAVSCHTGTVRWLRVYERTGAEKTRARNVSSREAKSWEINPTMWIGNDRILIDPADGEELLILSAVDGSRVASVSRERLGDARAILGAHDDLLFLAGSEITCYDWRADSIRWETRMTAESSPIGRGQWVDDRLLVPASTGLMSVRVADGALRIAPWPADEGPGNIVALEDRLLTATSKGLTAYARKAELWAALKQRMIEAPSDPLPALELAEIAFRMGERSDGLAALDEAVNRTRGFTVPMEQALQSRFFDDILAFVQLSATRGRLEGDVLEKLYGYACLCPPTPAAHVTFRLRFADVFRERSQPDRSLRLYQQILKDRSLRDVNVTDPSIIPRNGSPRRAALIARGEIASLMERFGSEIYAPFENEAQQWLNGARSAGDGASLAGLVETFPNSKAAPLALIAQGELYLRNVRPLDAASAFAKAYHRFPAQIDASEMLRRIADAYELAHKPDLAFLWLTRGIRDFPNVRFESEGRYWSFSQYRDRLSAALERIEPRRPSFQLPLTRRAEREFAGGVSLLQPRFPDLPNISWSAAFVHATDGIHALDPKTGMDQWSEPFAVAPPAELLLATNDFALFVTTHDVFALNTRNGNIRWSLASGMEHKDDDVQDWETGRIIRAVAVHGNRLVAAREDGWMTCLSMDDGATIWTQTHRPPPAGRMCLSDQALVYPVPQDGRTLLCVVDASNGAWRGGIHTEEDRATEELLLTVDEQALLITSRGIRSFDLQNMLPRWHVTPSGSLRKEAIEAEMDALYICPDGKHVEKLSLDHGGILWKSDRMPGVPRDEVTLRRQGTALIIAASGSVVAVDAGTGQTLWEGTVPRSARIGKTLMTDSFVVALDFSGEGGGNGARAYFYDHRMRSGVLAREGGVMEIGALQDFRGMFAADGAFIVQTGSILQFWSEKLSHPNPSSRE